MISISHAYSKLLSPAIRLMNRMSFSRKFALLEVITLIAVLVTVFSLYVSLSQTIKRTEREYEGLLLAQKAVKTIQLIQQFRGLSVGAVGGNSDINRVREVKLREVESELARLAAQLPVNSIQLESWKVITTNWKHIEAKGVQSTREENFNALTNLIDQIMVFESDISDMYGLTADPNLDTYFLTHTSGAELLMTLESLGQVRAYGTGILSEYKVTGKEVAKIKALITQLNLTFPPLKTSIRKASYYNPALKKPLELTYANIERASSQVVNTVVNQILTHHFYETPAEFFISVTKAIDIGYNELYATLFPAAENLLKERIWHAKTLLNVTIGLAGLLVLMLTYFLTAIYSATIGSILTLTQSVSGFVHGNMQDRVHLKTHDELRKIGDSFNIMADEIAELMAARQATMQYTRSLIESNIDPLIMISSAGIITDVNTATEHITGVVRDHLIGSDFADYFTEPDKAHAVYQEVFSLGVVTDYPLVIRHVSGKVIDVLYNASVYRDNAGQVLGVVAAARDVTKQKQMEDKIRQLAFYDALTLLPNRRLLNERLTQAMIVSKRSGCYAALMFLDLDNFKPLNDTHGHVVGDLLLIEAAIRLKKCVREADTVARFGGDEFVVMLSDLDKDKAESKLQVTHVAEKIREVLSATYMLNVSHEGQAGITVEHHCTASIGVTLFLGNEVHEENVMKYADAAMYQAKDAGRNSIAFYDENP